MKLTIPTTLQSEPEALHGRLRQASPTGGEVGAETNTLARLMHRHFVRACALPSPGLLVALARSEMNGEMAAVLQLRAAAEHPTRDHVVAFAEALVEHAQTEEAVMGPAAIPLGQVARQRLGTCVAGL